jgi:hypothetical protein
MSRCVPVNDATVERRVGLIGGDVLDDSPDANRCRSLPNQLQCGDLAPRNTPTITG